MSQFVHAGILVLDQDRTVSVAARAMAEKRCGCVLVTDKHRHVVGIVSDRDLTCEILAFDLPHDTPLSEVMTAEVTYVRDTDTIDDAINLMKSDGIRRLPVIQESGSRQRCVGIVTLDDLLASKKISLDDAAAIVRSQVVRRPRRHSNQEHTENKLEQTLNRFHRAMAQNLELPRDTAEAITFYLLSSLVKRLTKSGANNFIAQLPRLLQEDLNNMAGNPDRHVTLEGIIKHIENNWDLRNQTASEVVARFWMALRNYVSPGEMDNVLSQLPLEFRRKIQQPTQTRLH